ncbi:MAG: bifunctional hydroxymethylpyrimidine kinase/phosphomethylpyrimidine kinase [Lachnospiraceae bacterium]
MRFRREQVCVYAVTDRSWLGTKTLAEQVEEALLGGATMVQLREKNLGEQQFEQEARELKRLCHKYGVPLIINDHVELACRVDADGVHIGQNDMEAADVRRIIGPEKILGVTAKTVEQAIAAQSAGADYLGSGAVFPTGTKTDAKPLEHEVLQQICEAVQIPVVAIGGITKDNVLQLQGSDIEGVAVVSGIFAQKDIRNTTKQLRRLVQTMTMKTALTIAGSDSSGGAGIQADIKTMTANGVYAMSAVTALTAQNTTGVSSIMEVTPEFLADQLDSIFSDIYPNAVKTGMVSSSELIRVIADKLKEYHASNIVIDPVMVATSGARLIGEESIRILQQELLPIATVITPNIPEAEVLSGISVRTEEDMIKAAGIIYDRYGCAVLCKGGHNLNDANDLLYMNGKHRWFYGIRIENDNTHGTGCTLSSAIASNLAKGYALETSVEYAKEYIQGALSAMLNLGKGSGPMNHAWVR